MKPFKLVKSTITPLDKINVDTDQIIPKQFLKAVTKTSLGKYLFYNWRFDSNSKKIPSFVLNNLKYKKSNILVTRTNFGCGSSREHAVWAIVDYGFKVVISSSFADIFYNNCFKNGLLPIIVHSKTIDKLMKLKSEIEINLQKQIIKTNLESISFYIEQYRKNNLINGVDYISMTLKYDKFIKEYEERTNVPSIL